MTTGPYPHFMKISREEIMSALREPALPADAREAAWASLAKMDRQRDFRDKWTLYAAIAAAIAAIVAAMAAIIPLMLK